MSSRGISWVMGIRLADDASRPLLQFSRTAAKVAAETTRNARATSEALAKEARAAKQAAVEKARASEQAALAAKKSAADSVAAAQRAEVAGTKEARQAAADAARVAAAHQKAARAAIQAATVAERTAAQKQRASMQAATAVQTAATKEVAAQKQIDRARKQSAATAQATSKVGSSALIGYGKSALAFAGLGGIGAITRSAYTFDKAMREVAAVSQASGAEMASMTKTARSLGLEVGTGATAAADAMVELAKAGLSTKEIGPALKGVLQLSQAGGLAAAEASSAAANAMNAFGIAAKDTTKIADSFANAANLTTADVGDFALAISQGGSAAKLAGVSFNDTMLTLTQLAQVGVMGSDAGTSMKAAFLQLAKPTEQAAGAMKKYGLEFFTAEGNMKKVAEIGGMLQTKLGGLTKQQQVATLQTIAGTDGFRALAAMMGMTEKEAQKLEGQLTRTGAAGQMAADMQTPWERFKAAMEDIAITVGGPVLTELSKGAEAVSKFVRSAEGQEKIKELGESIKDAAEKITGLVKGVVKFGQENPELVKIAGTLLKIGIAAKAIKFAGAITGVSSLLRGLVRLTPIGRGAGGVLGRALGGALGIEGAGTAKAQLKKNGALTGGLSGRMKSVGTSLGSMLGLPMGRTAADKAAGGVGKNGAISGKAGGRMAPIGRALGVLMGAALAAAAINELTRAITGSSILDRLKDGMGLNDAPSGGGLPSDFPKKPASKMTENERRIAEWTRRSYGGATGGRLTTLGFRRFAAGGMVPAVVSPGELIEYGGQAGIVPGARVAADTVPMLLPVGARVFTDHGQDLMSMGASPEQALAQQVPHFREGGETSKKGKKAKPLRSARVGATVFDDPPPGAFGSLTNGYAELGTAKRTDGSATGFGWIAKALGLKGELPANQPLAITINGRTHTLRKKDRGYGQGGNGVTSDPSYALDIWKDSWSKFGINGNWKGKAEVALGTAAQVKKLGTEGRDYSYTVARSVGKSATRGGLLDDPYSVGFSGVEAFGSRAAARRAGVLMSPVRSALDDLKDSYTRRIERSAPSSRSAAESSSGSTSSSGRKPGGVKPSGGWSRPLSGPITSGFGMRGGRMHKGIDFGVPVGTAVRAVRAGTVALGMNDPGGWGMNTRVEHGGGLSSLYAHLSKIGMRPGAKVNAGDMIARSGNSGSSTGPHLHLETWRNGTAFNPAEVIKLRRGGLVGAARRFAAGGKVRQPTAVTSALAGVKKSTAGVHLSALSEAVSAATLKQIAELRISLLRGIRAGGDSAGVARLRAALSVLEIDLAGRVQEHVQRLTALTSGWERKTSESSHWMRRSGVDEGSSTGIRIGMVNAQTYLGSQSGSELRAANQAIQGARALLKDATSVEDREAARGKLTEAQEGKNEILSRRTESRTLIEELKRALPQAKAAERVGGLDFADAMASLAGRDPSADAGLLGARQQEYSRQLSEAMSTKNQAWATEAAVNLKGVQDSLRELPRTMGTKRVEGLDFADAWTSLHGRNPSTDAGLLGARRDEYALQLQQAQATGNQAWAIDAANSLKAIEDGIRALPAALADRALATLDADAAEASLTETKDDDIAVERAKKDRAQAALDEARERRRTARTDAEREQAEQDVVKYAGIVKSATDAIGSLDTSLQEMAQATADLTDLIRQQVENQQKLLNGSAASRDAITAAIGSAAAGYIGQNVMRGNGAGGFSAGGWRP